MDPRAHGHGRIGCEGNGPQGGLRLFREFGGGTARWNVSTDPESDEIHYEVYVCRDADFSSCPTPVRTVSLLPTVLRGPDGPLRPALHFHWSLDSSPQGSSPQFSGDRAAQTVFTAGVSGDYVRCLRVTDYAYVAVHVHERSVPCQQADSPPADFVVAEGMPLANPYNAGTWHWKVKAIDSAGNGTESEVESFVVN